MKKSRTLIQSISPVTIPAAIALAFFAVSSSAPAALHLDEPTDIIVYNDVKRVTTALAVVDGQIMLHDCPTHQRVTQISDCGGPTVVVNTSDLVNYVAKVVMQKVTEGSSEKELTPLTAGQVVAIRAMGSDVSKLAEAQRNLVKLRDEAAKLEDLVKFLPESKNYKADLDAKREEIKNTDALGSAALQIERTAKGLIEKLSDRTAFDPFLPSMNANQLHTAVLLAMTAPITITDGRGEVTGLPLTASTANRYFNRGIHECVGKASCDVEDALRVILFDRSRWKGPETATVTITCSNGNTKKIDFTKTTPASGRIDCSAVKTTH